MSSVGSSIMAWAIPNLCRIPREYLPTGFFISGSSPTRRIAAAICSSPIDLACQDHNSLYQTPDPYTYNQENTNYNTAKNISNNGKHKLCDCFSGVAKIKIMNTECTQKNTQETGNQFGFCIRCRSLFISYAAV